MKETVPEMGSDLETVKGLAQGSDLEPVMETEKGWEKEPDSAMA